jgi:hypothetical protein
MAGQTLAEIETHLNMSAADRSLWHIGSDDPIMQRRFEAVGATLVRERGGWKEYTIPANQISLRKPSQLTDEQRQARAEQARRRFSQNKSLEQREANGA